MAASWKRIYSLVLALGMLFSAGATVQAEGRLISPSKGAASSSSEKAPATQKAPSSTVNPDAFIAPMKDYHITQAQINAVKAMYPQAIYSVPGDNHDNTRDDKRTGMDFRLRKRLPFEFFDSEVENMLKGNQGFAATGEMCMRIEGKLLDDTEEQRKLLNHLTILDTWTIDWFDAHDTSYMHLDTSRRSLDLIHPPKSDCHWVTQVDRALDQALSSGPYLGSNRDYTPDIHRVDGCSTWDVDPDGTCAMEGCTFKLLNPTKLH